MARAGTNEAGHADRTAVLFDFDGTIVDTGPSVIRCAKHALAERGWSLDEVGDLRLLIGPPLPEGFRQVTGADEAEAEALVESYRLYFDEAVTAADYPPFPGMCELMEDLSAAGRKVGIATSRLEHRAIAMAKAAELPRADVLAGRVEPHRLTKAGAIRACLKQLGLSPRDAVMVGDRRNDVEGAHEVGLPCIGVWHDGDGRLELEEAGADRLCHGADELRDALGA